MQNNDICIQSLHTPRHRVLLLMFSLGCRVDDFFLLGIQSLESFAVHYRPVCFQIACISTTCNEDFIATSTRDGNIVVWDISHILQVSSLDLGVHIARQSLVLPFLFLPPSALFCVFFLSFTHWSVSLCGCLCLSRMGVERKRI